MIQNQEILYDSRYGNLTPEVAEKIRKSREEVKKLKGRALKCPVCGFRIEEIYGITMGIVCNLRSPTATGAVVNGHSAERQRPA